MQNGQQLLLALLAGPGDAEIERMILRRCILLCRLYVTNGPDAVHHHLRILVLADGDAPADNDSRTLVDQAAVLVQRAGEDEQLHTACVVLERDIGHQALIARRFHLCRLDDTRDGDDLLVLIDAVMIFQALHNPPDGHNARALQLFAVIVHRMAGEIESRRLALHAHALLRGKLRQIGHVNVRDRRVIALHHAEQPHLSLDVFAAAGRDRLHHGVVDGQQLRTPQPEAVARAALDEVFHRTLIEIRAVHAVTEAFKIRERAAVFPLLHDLLDEAAADVLDGREAEADAVRHDGKMVVRFVDVRRQERNAHVLALGDIL